MATVEWFIGSIWGCLAGIVAVLLAAYLDFRDIKQTQKELDRQQRELRIMKAALDKANSEKWKAILRVEQMEAAKKETPTGKRVLVVVRRV